MNITMRSVLALLCTLFLFLAAVRAQGNLTPTNLADLIQDDVVTKVTGAEDVTVSYVFPDSALKRFPVGEPIEVLVGFKNKGQRQFNISFIDASLNFPEDFSFYIQNFSRWEYGMPVSAQEEVTLSYMFRPDPMLEPREFGLLVNVYYKDLSGKNYTNTAYNGTVDLTESSEGFDAQSLFSVLIVLSLIGVGIFFAYRYLSTWAKKQKSGKRVEYGTKVRQEVEDDWLTGTSADPALRKRKQQGGQKKKVNKSG